MSNYYKRELLGLEIQSVKLLAPVNHSLSALIRLKEYKLKKSFLFSNLEKWVNKKNFLLFNQVKMFEKLPAF